MGLHLLFSYSQTNDQILSRMYKTVMYLSSQFATICQCSSICDHQLKKVSIVCRYSDEQWNLFEYFEMEKLICYAFYNFGIIDRNQ